MLSHMRTTIHLSEGLMHDLKRYAAESRQTLRSIIEDAVREVLARRRKGTKPLKPVHLPTDGKGGLLPGVDLDNNAALLDLMEGR